jgi:hypothetical protein
MSTKGATLFLAVLKNDEAQLAFWKPFLERLEEGTYAQFDTPSMLVVGLQANRYGLVDHQFVRVALNATAKFANVKGEIIVLLPRQHVLVIIEGKSVPLEIGFRRS